MYLNQIDVMVRNEQVADMTRAQAHARLVREVERGEQTPSPKMAKTLSLTSVLHNVLSVLGIARASRPLPLQ